MTWWKVKLGDPDEDHTIELYNAHWRQEENFKDVEDVIDIEEERQIPRSGEEDQEDQIQDDEDQEDEYEEKVEEGSDEDWGDEVEAYSRRGGLGVR